MPPRNIKKSKSEGLYKRCAHLSWDRCDCAWWGRKNGERVSLEKWAGAPIRSKEMAKAIFGRMEAAVVGGTFDRSGERPATDGEDITFGVFLDKHYIPRHLEAKGRRSNSLNAYISVFRAKFGSQPMRKLASDPNVFEKWLEEQRTELEWQDRSYNRYVEHGRAMFNWALKRGMVASNPFSIVERRPGENSREKRFTSEQLKALLNACATLDEPPQSKLVKVTNELLTEIRERANRGEMQKDIAGDLGLSRALVCQIIGGRVWNPSIRKGRVGAEMRRRLIAAVDLGLRSGEMLLIQVKHVDFNQWVINLPPSNTKGGATTGETEQILVESERVREILNARRSLGPEAYVFGKESGAYVGDFGKSWHRLFLRAGIPPGRKDDYIWHDLRHEYGSHLVDQGATIQEAKELMRHADIRTTETYLKARDGRLRELARLSERK